MQSCLWFWPANGLQWILISLEFFEIQQLNCLEEKFFERGLFENCSECIIYVVRFMNWIMPQCSCTLSIWIISEWRKINKKEHALCQEIFKQTFILILWSFWCCDSLKKFSIASVFSQTLNTLVQDYNQMKFSGI